MGGVASEAFFLAGADGSARFCMHHAPGKAVPAGANPAVPAKGLLVFLPPWADEMNKSRRMVRLQAQQLAAAGYAVLQMDLTGCGDSAGDHSDATWDQWLQDGLDACAWMMAKYPNAPVVLWGLRAGCLLAGELASRIPIAAGLLLWNPPASGRVLWQQFLRLATASALTGDAGKGRADAVKQRLQQGQPVDVAGYEVNAALAKGLESSVLKLPENGSSVAVALLETGAQATAELSPANQAFATQWRAAGHRVSTQRVQGPAFWQTTEIEDAPALLAATLAAVVELVATPTVVSP